MPNLDLFTVADLWSPYVIIATLIIAGIYLALVGPLRPKELQQEPYPLRQVVYFLSGLLVFYIAQGSPLDLLAHLIFSAHMSQMALLYLVVPPLLIIGTPTWMFEKMLSIKGFGTLFRFFAKPMISILLFNGFFSLYHVPIVLDTVMTNYSLHTFYIILLFVTAYLMWWPIVTPMKDDKRLSHLRKIVYLVIDGILMTPACALIIFADYTLYDVYANPDMWMTALGYCVPDTTLLAVSQVSGPDYFAIFPPIHDQQLGGTIMKIMQELMYGIFLGYTFYHWMKNEKAKEREAEQHVLSSNLGNQIG